jgi:hypothetical protein
MRNAYSTAQVATNAMETLCSLSSVAALVGAFAGLLLLDRARSESKAFARVAVKARAARR